MKLICELCAKPCLLSFDECECYIPDYCPFGDGAEWVEFKGSDDE